MKERYGRRRKLFFQAKRKCVAGGTILAGSMLYERLQTFTRNAFLDPPADCCHRAHSFHHEQMDLTGYKAILPGTIF